MDEISESNSQSQKNGNQQTDNFKNSISSKKFFLYLKQIMRSQKHKKAKIETSLKTSSNSLCLPFQTIHLTKRSTHGSSKRLRSAAN